MSTLSTRASRRGLTLLELIVVLLILVALAGALIPILEGFVERAHGASGADQLGEVAKALQHYRLDYKAFPENLDSLAVDATTVWFGLPGGATTYTPGTLTVAEADALIAVGITDVIPPGSATSGHATEDYGVSGGTPETPDAVAAALPVVFLTAAQETALGLETAHKYVMFGFGRRNAAIGRVCLAAPLHYLDDATPDEVYSYFAVIFQLTEGDGTVTAERARFVGTGAIHDDGPEGISQHILEYHEGIPK